MIDGTGYATAAAATLNTGTSTPSGASINIPAGFSIIKVTTTSTPSYTVAHGLGVKPALTMWKRTDSSENWWVYLSDDLFSYASGVGYLILNNTDPIANDTGAAAFTTSLMPQPTTGVKDYISYTFASIPNYSLISIYTGTGSATETPIIYTGFEPAWIMVKRTDSTGAWNITDNKRNTSNPRNSIIEANAANPEYTNVAYNINFYNNGFQINNNHADWNAAGGKYLFMCFAS